MKRWWLFIPRNVWEQYDIKSAEQMGLRLMIPIIDTKVTYASAYSPLGFPYYSIKPYSIEEITKDFDYILVLK